MKLHHQSNLNEVSWFEEPIKAVAARRIDDDVFERAVVLNAAEDVTPIDRGDAVGVLLKGEAGGGPQMFLSGDRNLAFNGQPIKPGLFALTTNNPAISWTKTTHKSCGNILLSDGSVQTFTSHQLSLAARDQGGEATNRRAIP